MEARRHRGMVVNEPITVDGNSHEKVKTIESLGS